jgi:hypothetical protein
VNLFLHHVDKDASVKAEGGGTLASATLVSNGCYNGVKLKAMTQIAAAALASAAGFIRQTDKAYVLVLMRRVAADKKSVRADSVETARTLHLIPSSLRAAYPLHQRIYSSFRHLARELLLIDSMKTRWSE